MSDALTFLQGDSQGPKRDLIARYYYEVAQGDPKSAPVGFAVLLDACAEQVGKVPEELRTHIADFKRTLAEASRLERGFMEKVDRCNDQVITSFREDTRQAHAIWTGIFQYAQTVTDKAENLAQAITPVISTTEQLAADLRLLREDLKQHRDSVARVTDIADAVRSIQTDSFAIIKRLTRQSQTNRVTMGVLFGMMAYGFGEQALPSDLPLFDRMGFLVLGLCIIQWVVNSGWNAILDGPKYK
jgi:archaellum component FlaC